MKPSSIPVALIAFAVTAPLSFSQFIIQPLTEATSKDTKIYNSVPASNFSSNLNVVLQDVGAHFLGLVQFDLSSLGSLTPSQITSATFTLYSTGLGVSGGPAAGGTVTVSPILNAWRENADDPGTDPLATYNAFFGPSPTLTLGSAVASQNVTAPGFVNWDITNLVKAWVGGSVANHGVLFQLSTNGGDVGFADVDSSTVIGSAPKLTVVPEPSTFGLLLLSSAAVGWSVIRRRKAAGSAMFYQD